jgi:hypothetical protein
MPGGHASLTSVQQSRFVESQWSTDPGEFPEYQSFFGALPMSTDSAWERAEAILTGIETLAQRRGDPMHRITRIELVLRDGYSRQRGRRGAVLFSPARGAELHCVHALAGYGGSGPMFTEQIFDVFGAAEVFNQINTELAHQNSYHVIASREPTTVIDGVEASLPYVQPLAEWRWWRLY